MLYTIAGAAKASGLSEAAILRAIERREIPGIKDLFGEWQVEDTDIPRLFFPIGQGATRADPAPASATDSTTAVESAIAAPIHQAGDGNEDRRAGDNSSPPAVVDDGVLCSETAPENDPAQFKGAFLPVRDCFSARTKESARPPKQGAQLQFSSFDQTDSTIIDETFSWHDEIKVDDRHKIFAETIPAPANRRRNALFAGTLFGVLSIGWIAGFSSYQFFGRSLLASSDAKGSYSARSSADQMVSPDKVIREPAPGALVTGKITTSAAPQNRTGRRYQPAPSTAQIPGSQASKPIAIAQQSSAETASESAVESGPDGVKGRVDGLLRRVPVAETKPTSIQGWTVRTVYNGTAVLVGPAGMFKVAPGDTVPGLGRVDSIVLWGSHWIVATSRGLVTTP